MNNLTSWWFPCFLFNTFFHPYSGNSSSGWPNLSFLTVETFKLPKFKQLQHIFFAGGRTFFAGRCKSWSSWDLTTKKSWNYSCPTELYLASMKHLDPKRFWSVLRVSWMMWIGLTEQSDRSMGFHRLETQFDYAAFGSWIFSQHQYQLGFWSTVVRSTVRKIPLAICRCMCVSSMFRNGPSS